MTTQKIVSRWDSSKVLFECELPEGLASGLAMRHALEKAVQKNTDLSDADLSDADLRGAYLSGADLSGADLSGADLSGAYLSGADLSGAYLSDADLRGAYLSGADLRDADLRGAYLSGAYLRGAYLSGADLRGAGLSGADLSGAYLRGAYLRGADLRGAGLSGADLSGAYLRGVERASDEQAIANLDKVREIILDDKKRLEMGHWHADESDWRNKSCAEEMLCGTTHCLAGWLQVCSTDKTVREMETQLAGIVQAPVAAKMFFRGADEVLSWLDERKYVTELAESAKRREERAARKVAEAGAPDER